MGELDGLTGEVEVEDEGDGLTGELEMDFELEATFPLDFEASQSNSKLEIKIPARISSSFIFKFFITPVGKDNFYPMK